MVSDKVNLVKSVYPFDDISQRIFNNAEQNKLVVLNKNKVKNMLDTIGIQPSEVSRILNLLKNSLSQLNEDVKHQSRTSDLDNKYLNAVNSGDVETAQKLVDEAVKENGYTIKAYHGTSRSDRVGNVFLLERATSGPMAFFTDSKEIASNYARDKQDTSLAYDEEYSDYYTQFRTVKNGKSIPVSELWKALPVGLQ